MEDVCVPLLVALVVLSKLVLIEPPAGQLEQDAAVGQTGLRVAPLHDEGLYLLGLLVSIGLEDAGGRLVEALLLCDDQLLLLDLPILDGVAAEVVDRATLPLARVQKRQEFVHSLIVHEGDEVDFFEELALRDGELVQALALGAVPGAVAHAARLEAAAEGLDERDKLRAAVTDLESDSALELALQFFLPDFLGIFVFGFAFSVPVLLVEALMVEGIHRFGVVREGLVAAHDCLHQAEKGEGFNEQVQQNADERHLAPPREV
mmetsp:Transcript_1435/g.2348  ORF Transcript_1435/g.2348 Transcript_1435/m.2348 type:complete len:262 (-) Transcript_1435:179-964(-)